MTIPISVPGASRLQQLESQNPNSSGTKYDIFPSTGLGDLAAIQPVSEQMADWYRKGQGVSREAGSTSAVEPKRLVPFGLKDTPGENEASIRILNNKNADLIPPFTKMFLESVQDQHSERSQIVETFGDFYVFMFGERPPMYNFSGTLINAENARWATDFKFYYDRFLRGTKCVSEQARAVLTYGGQQVEGYILSTSSTVAAQNDAAVPFGFQMVVTSRKYLGFSNDFGLVTVGGKDSVDSRVKAVLDAIAGKTGKGSSEPSTSSAIKQATDMGKGLVPPSITSVGK